MIVLAALLALTPPPPPTTMERTTPLPVYSAKCRLTGRDARNHKLSLTVSGVGPTRRVTVRSGSGPLKQLTALDQESSVGGIGNNTMLWTTGDYVRADLGGQAVAVSIDVNPHVAEGAAISIIDPRQQSRLPLFAGMCRTKALEGSLSS